jgi:hypothetical protein
MACAQHMQHDLTFMLHNHSFCPLPKYTLVFATIYIRHCFFAVLAGWDWSRQRQGHLHLLLDDIHRPPGTHRFGPVCDYQSVLRAVTGLQDAMLGVCTSMRFPLSLLKTAKVDDLHKYAEDFVWLFGEAAVNQLASPDETHVVHLAATVADGIIQHLTLIPPTHLVDFWQFLESDCSLSQEVKASVWATRMNTLVLHNFTKVLRVQLDQSSSKPTIFLSHLLESHARWSCVSDHGLRDVLLRNNRHDVGQLVATHATRRSTWNAICDDVVSVLAAWDSLASTLRERVQRAKHDRRARVHAHLQSRGT